MCQSETILYLHLLKEHLTDCTLPRSSLWKKFPVRSNLGRIRSQFRWGSVLDFYIMKGYLALISSWFSDVSKISRKKFSLTLRWWWLGVVETAIRALLASSCLDMENYLKNMHSQCWTIRSLKCNSTSAWQHPSPLAVACSLPPSSELQSRYPPPKSGY